jgi:NADPH:quinone reductase-like Zn-dependent oxidoreductase
VKAAIVREYGKPPVYGDFPDPQAAPGKTLVRVAASAISHLTRGRAAGTHYSAKASLPFVPGIDGAGTTSDGKRVFFLATNAPYGAMAEYTLAGDDEIVPIPDALSCEQAAALANPGMSSWAALVERAYMRRGETVLVNGAAGTAGRLAIQIAKYLGAKKVIATARRPETFDELRRLGADETIALVNDRSELEVAFKPAFEGGVDIVLDYLWGVSAEALITAGAKYGDEDVPICFVQIGSMSGANIALPAAALRSSKLEIVGSGIGSVSRAQLLAAIRGVLDAAPSAGFTIAVNTAPLADVARVWDADEGERTILLP